MHKLIFWAAALCALTGCTSDSATSNCTSLTVDGKLIVDGTFVVPPCGIVIADVGGSEP